MNYDGSKGANFGKIKIKDNAKLANKQNLTLNFDFGGRISEEDVINKASSVYFYNKGYWPSDYCNDTDITINENESQTQHQNNNSTIQCKRKPTAQAYLQC